MLVHNKDMPSITAVQVSALFGFYLILELLPIAFVQSFYSVPYESGLSEKSFLLDDDNNDYDLGTTSCVPSRVSSRGSMIVYA